jgi:hypothetical protein
MEQFHDREISRRARVSAALIVGCLAGVLTAILSLVIDPIYAVIIAGMVVGLGACVFVRVVLHWPLRNRARRVLS